MGLSSALVAVAAGFAVYILVVSILVRRYQLKDSPRELLVLELARPGHHIALTHYEPDTRLFREPVLLCHGLAANRFNMDFIDDGTGSDRRSLARYLARAGFDTWVLETRGHGYATTPKNARYDADDELSEDVPTAVEAVLDQTGADKLWWVGHSWGGLLQVLFQARGHPLADRVAGLVALGSPGTLSVQDRLRWVKPLGRVALWTLLYRVPLRAIAHFLMPLLPLLAFVVRRLRPEQAVMETQFLLHLFASLAEDIPTAWLKKSLTWAEAGSFPDEKNFARIQLPMLLIAGANDLIAPPEAVRFLADGAGSGDISFRTMGRADGCSVDYGHGGLLVAREAPDEVYPVVGDWLAARAERVESVGEPGPISDLGPSMNGKMNGTSVIR